MTKITTKRGSEGPRHDPYSWTEIAVHRSDCTVTFHEGLGCYVDVQGGLQHDRLWMTSDDSRARVEAHFERFAGVSVKTAQRAYDEFRARKVRYHACGPKHLGWVAGYPGEDLLFCANCKTILDATFDLSAVE